MNQNSDASDAEGSGNSHRRSAITAGLMVLASAGLFLYLTLPLIEYELTSSRLELIEQTGNKIVGELMARNAMAETLSHSLANLGETLPRDADIYREVVPRVLDLEGRESLVAGGGIWPEPGKFIEGVDRHSFFWGRNESGQLEFFNDYNEPDGPGYHNEEWYVPARYAWPGACYWSKSYVDPYSMQPMVTCTAPMRMDNEFLGVATIDLRLEGLKAFFEKEAAATNGYVFAVDQHNRFITFPQDDLVQIASSEPDGAPEFKTTSQFADDNPEFIDIAGALAQINAEAIAAAPRSIIYDAGIVASIAEDSYQIDESEAPIIMASLMEPTRASIRSTHLLKQFDIESDVLLKEPSQVSIFKIPNTYWKIVLVSPSSHSEGLQDRLINRVIIAAVVLLGGMILAMLLLMLSRSKP